MSPKLPSCTKSRKLIPLPVYLLAILTTRRKLASINLSLATGSPSDLRLASSSSSSAVNNGTVPISFKYILTGSSVPTPSSKPTLSNSTISSSSSKSSSVGSKSIGPSAASVKSASVGSASDAVSSALSTSSLSVSSTASTSVFTLVFFVNFFVSDFPSESPVLIVNPFSIIYSAIASLRSPVSGIP